MTTRENLNLAAILRQIADDVDAGWVGEVHISEHPDEPLESQLGYKWDQRRELHLTVGATYTLRNDGDG